VKPVGSMCLLLGLVMRCSSPAVDQKAPEPAAAVAPAPAVAQAEPVHAIFLGEGSLEAHGVKTARTRLAIERLNITATASGDVAETTVEHVFRNDSDEQLEGTFHFPLPEGAIIVGLALEMNGRLVDGELVERDKARKAYEETVDRMLDPALLEWESGESFKLSVFPIEARQSKRVVLRFLAPLHRARDGLFFAYRPPSPDAGLSPERVHVTLDGRTLASGAATRTPTGELLVKVGATAPDVVVEHTREGSYVHAWLHVVPTDAPAPATDAPKALVLLCDRSRSMLEAPALEAKTTSFLLDQLGPADRFIVVTGDVTAQALPGGMRTATAEDKQQAVAFLDRSEPDGASDLAELVVAGGRAAADARAAGLSPVVVYVGDATPTWGDTKTADIERAARQHLHGAPLHVVLLGKSIDDVTARTMSATTYGRLLRPRTEDDARRAAALVVHADRSRRVDDAHLVGAEGLDVAGAIPSTIFEGDEIGLSLFVPAGTAPKSLAIAGTFGARAVERPIDLSSATEARYVGQRWADAKIEALEAAGGAHKEEVVKASLAHGVMSRYASFLVLESEEAYARMNIPRKARQTDPDTRISGQDLESADGRAASVTPDHLQPGDPEVRVPAPADARSVVVVFPFGETKVATFEPDETGGMWVARFLVDRHTPDGTYQIVVRVTDRDGRVETMQVPYIVDTKGPHLTVTFRPTGRAGAFEIVATQVLTPDEIAAQSPRSTATLDQQRTRLASVLTDAARVEVRTPDEQILLLTHVSLAEFRGVWTPKGPVPSGSVVRVVAVDRARNETETEARVP